MLPNRINYKFWIVIGLLLIALQWFVFDRVANCRVNMSALHVEAEANNMRTEIKQSILDKQRATTAIALTLSNEFSKLPLDSTLGENAQVNDLIERIKQFSDYKNLWIQVVNPQGFSIYRSWSPIRNNLAKIRPEFDYVKQTGKPVIGVSTGSFDVSIKVVTPLMKEGKLVGFLDLISHFNSIQKRLQRIGIDSIVVASKARTAKMKHPFSHNRIGAYYVANLQPAEAFFNTLSESQIDAWIAMPKDYRFAEEELLVRYPLASVDGEVHGYLFARKEAKSLQQKEDELADLRVRMSLLIIVDIVIVLFSAMLIALYFMRRQKDYYRAILNYEEEAVLVTNGKQLIDANEQLYRYFPQVKRGEGDCICNYFEERSGFIKKYMKGVLWIDYLLAHPDKQHKALVKVHGEYRTFQLKVRELGENKQVYVVVLFDITQLENLNSQLHTQSRTDALTGVGNRLAFNEALRREVVLAKRNEHALSVIMFDIDFFKKVNDQFGHAYGDEVLVKLTANIQQELRETDSLYRIGGEEFVLLLAMQDQQAALAVAEKIRRKIESVNFSQAHSITISLGITQFTDNDSEDSILARADSALYQAKGNGRNQTVVL